MTNEESRRRPRSVSPTPKKYEGDGRSRDSNWKAFYLLASAFFAAAGAGTSFVATGEITGYRVEQLEQEVDQLETVYRQELRLQQTSYSELRNAHDRLSTKYEASQVSIADKLDDIISRLERMERRR